MYEILILVILGVFLLASLTLGIIDLTLINKQRKQLNDYMEELDETFDEFEKRLKEEFEIIDNALEGTSSALMRVSLKQLIYDYSILKGYQEELIKDENFEEAALVKSDMARIKSSIRIAITHLTPEEAEEYADFLEN